MYLGQTQITDPAMQELMCRKYPQGGFCDPTMLERIAGLWERWKPEVSGRTIDESAKIIADEVQIPVKIVTKIIRSTAEGAAKGLGEGLGPIWVIAIVGLGLLFLSGKIRT